MDESTAYRKALETATFSQHDGVETTELAVPGLTVLAHPDVRRIGEEAVLRDLRLGKTVYLSRLKPVFSGRRALADPHLSRHPVELRPIGGGGIRLITGTTTTRVVADGVGVSESLDLSAAQIERGVVLLLAGRIVLLLHTLDLLPVAAEAPPSFGLVGKSAAIADLRAEILRVADLDVPVLLLGETGTGKELVATAIHEASPRHERPLVVVNMGAVPRELAAAELFGAAKGAFTGADRRRGGFFSRAHTGTLFLDEIAEAPPEVQVLLLRALETGTIQAVGSETPEDLDVRFLAATDADLDAEVEAGRFRAPLVHRLRSYEIHLPPLRRRRDDLGLLLVHFLRRELEALGEAWRLEERGAEKLWLDARLVARLAAYSWPGNVRELRNVARQLVIGNRGAEHLRIPPRLVSLLGEDEASDPSSVVTKPDSTATPAADPSEAAGEAGNPSYRSRFDVDEEELVRTLKGHRYRLRPAAEALGISRTSLYKLIDESPRIRKAHELSREEVEDAGRRCGGDVVAMAEGLKVSDMGLRRRMTDLGLP